MDFIVKNWALVAIAALSGGMLLWPLLRKGAGGPWVSTLQATQLLNREDALLVDVRPAARASSTPCAERSTSVQPVKRFSRFQPDSPWRSRTS